MKTVAMDAERFEPSRVSRAIFLLDLYSRDGTAVIYRSLGPSGISNRDLQILLTIDRTPGIRPSALANELKVSRALLSQSLSRFESFRLVGRSIDPADRRSARLTITRAGRAKIQAFEAELGAWLVRARPTVREMHTLLNRRFTADVRDELAPLDAAEVLAAAGRDYVAELQPRLMRFGRLTLNQRLVLSLIDAYGPRRPVQLANELALTTGGISVILDHLETLKLVKRQRSSAEGDRKAVTVKLTAIGEQAVATEREVFLKHSDQLLHALAQPIRVIAGTADDLRSETDTTARAAQ